MESERNGTGTHSSRGISSSVVIPHARCGVFMSSYDDDDDVVDEEIYLDDSYYGKQSKLVKVNFYDFILSLKIRMRHFFTRERAKEFIKFAHLQIVLFCCHNLFGLVAIAKSPPTRGRSEGC